MSVNRRYEVNFPVIIFGNGLEAVLINFRKFFDKNGVEMVELIMKPTFDLVVNYGLVDNDYFDISRGLIKRSYLSSDFVVLNQGFSNGRYLLWCGFLGEKTDLSSRGGVDLFQERVLALEKINGFLKKENAYLLSVLRDKTSQIGKLEDDELKRFNKISSNNKNNLMLEPYFNGGGEQG